MTWRSDSASLVPGAWVSSAYHGFGVRGDQIPQDGDNAPSALANDVTLPAQAADEFRLIVLTRPAQGTLVVDENGAYQFSGAPDGVYTWTYRGFRNNVTYGDFTVTMRVGGVNLDGEAADQVTASGALTAAILLAGAALSAASANGALGAQVPLSGAAMAQALASGVLTTQIPLAGTALVAAGATGTLTVQIAGLGGDAIARAQAAGSLSTGITLAGAALAVTTAGGSIAAVPIDLAGSAVVIAVADGQLTASIRLSAAAIARATATGDLSGGSVVAPPAQPALFSLAAVRHTTHDVGALRAVQMTLGARNVG